MNEYHKGQVRVGLWWAWTFGAVVLFFAGLQSFPTQSGSGPALGSPGTGYIWLGPVIVGVAIAAAILGIIAIVLEHRRLAAELRIATVPH